MKKIDSEMIYIRNEKEYFRNGLDGYVPNNQHLRSHYITEPKYESWIQCVACGYRLYDEQTYISKNYCPNCGAKMEKEDGKVD